MRMAPLGLDNLIVVNEEARHAAFEVARRGAGGVDSKMEGKQVRNTVVPYSMSRMSM